MAKRKEKSQEKVMEFVQEELVRNPDISTSELFGLAKKVDSKVGKLTLRQFNARYPLQIKRKQTMSRPRRKARTAARRRLRSASQGHDGVREAFLRFAEDLSAAEERKDLVRVLASVDRYVEAAMESLDKGGAGRRKSALEGQSELAAAEK